jgi:hypothetical protein
MITFTYPYTTPTDTVTLGGERDAEERGFEPFEEVVITEDGKMRTYQTGPTQGYTTNYPVRFWLHEDAAKGTSNLAAFLSFVTTKIRFAKYPFKFTDGQGAVHRVRLIGGLKTKQRARWTEVEVTLQEDFV